MTITKKYSVGSLFAGVGGVCLGFKQAEYENIGFKLTWANEMDEYAAETYGRNFDHDLIVGDIEKVIDPNLCDIEKEEYMKKLEEEHDERKKLKIKKQIENCEKEKPEYEIKRTEILKNKIDVLMGGFPCQAFSIAGERKGFDDHRGNLFWSIINLVNLLEPIHGKPRVLFMENVKNLRSHDGGRTYSVIKGELEKAGYIIKDAILNTMDYSDLPQNRERIYIVGFLNKEDADKFTMFDNLNKYIKVKHPDERLEDIKKVLDLHLTKKDAEQYYYTKDKYPGYFITQEEYLKLADDERKEIRINLDEQIREEYQFYQVRRGMYVRQNKSNVCPTLTANMGTGGHNVPLIKVKDGIRKLTPAETFKIQGFPIGNGYTLPEMYGRRKYPNGALYKQAGNAVSVPVIKLIAEEILKALK
ncbi:DNA (cytosine-5-)-methyltransferase [Clostridium botulinum]|uniref:DNA cytosine methyltransferase n=1 Tax=Clostridium botulinum TaxID=1491 RepID=UPI0013C8F702|nr:DNA (cytosine-5-)-methyltransferase [Clostridium botulinum]MBY7024801.1 DNA (cytosine-5-)-methyltransferase [Clostridium botulinum]NFN19722.1 DNA (cytosine-5-)-methyltransferase [Clostridium botulinum]NFN50008.1 DNA (cytosine-5-)-methyltransferase [Clostridium botulinum]